MRTNNSDPSPASGGFGRLRDRIALIAGGATGIGEATARMFAREGARVAIGDIRCDLAARVASEIVAGGGVAVAFEVDVTNDDSVRMLVESAVYRFGALHVVFNSAGGSLPQDAPATEVDLAVWERTMNLDARGTLLCCRHAIPAIIRSGGGAVVNMASGAALRGSGRAHAYAAAKGAVVSLTRALAGAYAVRGVRVNAICAGRVNTARIRQSYGVPGQPGPGIDAFQGDEQVRVYPFWLGEPDDIAHIATFLASDESRMITGAAIPADGGRSAY